MFDIKQAVRAGVDPYEMCRAMGDRIVHIHLNDNDDHRDCLVPWQGTMDYSHLFGQLFDQGFSQDIILEVYGPILNPWTNYGRRNGKWKRC